MSKHQEGLTITALDGRGLSRLEQVQVLPIDLATAWDFFSNPNNLNDLTPPSLGFRNLTPTPPMFAGQMLAYRIRLMPGYSTTWVTEITQCVPPTYFVDEQRQGPYAMWHHEHWFEPCDDGVRMIDRVTYRVPGWILAPLIDRLFIQRQLQTIFSYRRQVLNERFIATSAAA